VLYNMTGCHNLHLRAREVQQGSPQVRLQGEFVSSQNLGQKGNLLVLFSSVFGAMRSRR
jgi:hypothetical protein